MNDRVDTLGRVLEVGTSRRTALGLLGAAALAPLADFPAPDATADRKRKGARGRKRRGGEAAPADATMVNGKAPNANGTRLLFRDDFIHGFDTARPEGNWFYFGTSTFLGNDGEETTGPHGLRVRSEPFTNTVPQGADGAVDHVKWLAYANRFANGVPGFAAERGRALSVEATVSAQTFHTDQHPFGDAVDDPEDDLRLASAALNGIDFASFMVFDIFLTNKRIYAFYERLPFGRTATHNYAAFSFQIPLLDRKPQDEHRLSVVYDRAEGTVRWLVDGQEQFRVDHLGYRIDRKYMTLDHGGEEEAVEPEQLDFGMGLFTLLDGQLPSGTPLIRLSDTPGFYANAGSGAALPANTFVDPNSRVESRLFGQGAELRVERFTVESRRSG